jgi:hypothetical protein
MSGLNFQQGKLYTQVMVPNQIARTSKFEEAHIAKSPVRRESVFRRAFEKHETLTVAGLTHERGTIDGYAEGGTLNTKRVSEI